MGYKNKRFDPCSPYSHPRGACELAERRCGEMVEKYNWAQTYPSHLPGLAPRPTLIDLVTSAYLQGVSDAIEAATNKGWLNAAAMESVGIPATTGDERTGE